MQSFHLQIYAGRDDDPPRADAASSTYGGRTIPCGRPPQSPGFFACSFEQWLAGLRRFGPVYAEGDGSWSWVASEKVNGRPAWRLEGMIYDRGGAVFYVDVQGYCPPEAWQDFLSLLSLPPGGRPALCLAEYGTWVEADDFLEYLRG